MFKVGDDYILISHTKGTINSLNCKIVNTYEEKPGVWVVVIREPQTGTLLKRRRVVKATTITRETYHKIGNLA